MWSHKHVMAFWPWGDLTVWSCDSEIPCSNDHTRTSRVTTRNHTKIQGAMARARATVCLWHCTVTCGNLIPIWDSRTPWAIEIERHGTCSGQIPFRYVFFACGGPACQYPTFQKWSRPGWTFFTEKKLRLVNINIENVIMATENGKCCCWNMSSQQEGCWKNCQEILWGDVHLFKWFHDSEAENKFAYRRLNGQKKEIWMVTSNK